MKKGKALCSSEEHRIYYDMEICLIKNGSYFAGLMEKGDLGLLRLFKKKSKAVGNWHSKAMLIDPKKTKLVMINIRTLNKQGEISADA